MGEWCKRCSWVKGMVQQVQGTRCRVQQMQGAASTGHKGQGAAGAE